MKVDSSTDGSAFGEWFKAQYKALPNADRVEELRVKVRSLEAKLAVAKADLQGEEWLHWQFTAALRGWNANSNS